jgi:hypothetical protein
VATNGRSAPPPECGRPLALTRGFVRRQSRV